MLSRHLLVGRLGGAPERDHHHPHGAGVFVLCDRVFLDVRSGVPVKDEDALVVTAVVVAGVGDGGSGGAWSAMSMR
jgi:hypothetical protein